MRADDAQAGGSWSSLRASQAYRKAEARLGFAAICIVGTSGPQRRSWQDNQGAYPTRIVVTTGDPAKAATIYNRGVHSADGIYHTLAYVYARTVEHGEIVKGWLEKQVQGEPMVNGWRDLEGWQYEILFGVAAEQLKIELFDEASKQQRIWAEAKRR